nr:PhaM family polyhydroxyalkanoate granule multifunctional regulatory protein [uncultured Noviherbaspirillum sp.]
MAESNMSGIPGVGAMTDTLEFVKNLWGGMKVPGMAMPSLSVDEVDKQIKDLKAVESWLNVNMSMLRSTIQALEVQSATLSALQTMSASMNSLAQAGAAGLAAAAPSAPSTPAKSAAAPAPSFSFEPPVAEKPAAPGGTSSPAPSDRPAEAPQANVDMSNAPAFANPAAWWNLLQDQFKQAVSTAVAEPEAVQKPASEAAKPRARKSAPAAAKKSAPARKGAKKS